MTSNPESNGHSSLVGGSSAEKRINCPASYQLEQRLPPELKRESSSYADEGTAMHSAVQYVLENNLVDLDQLLGMEFGGSEDGSRSSYVVTKDLLDSCITPCIDFFDALDDELKDEGGLDFMLEARCEMPGIPNAFGTSDLIARTSKRSIIADWKFGVGVKVDASYWVPSPTDPAVEIMKPNAQLMFYARAAMHSFPDMFGEGDNWPVDLYIVQPRARDGDGTPSMVTVTRRQLEAFRMELVRAVAEAQGENARMQRGKWCTFAQCKTICPKFIGPALDLTKMHKAIEAKKEGTLEGLDIDWAVVYGDMLTFADLVEEIIGEIRAQAHTFMDAGNQIVDAEGNQSYKLVPKRATTVYTDADAALREAQKLSAKTKKSFVVADCYSKPEIISPAQLRAVIADKLMEGPTKKAREEAAKEWMKPYVANVSSGTTIAPAGDPRGAAIPPAEYMLQLANKLSAISGQ